MGAKSAIDKAAKVSRVTSQTVYRQAQLGRTAALRPPQLAASFVSVQQDALSAPVEEHEHRSQQDSERERTP
jgi:hypothetical protein